MREMVRLTSTERGSRLSMYELREAAEKAVDGEGFAKARARPRADHGTQRVRDVRRAFNRRRFPDHEEDG